MLNYHYCLFYAKHGNIFMKIFFYKWAKYVLETAKNLWKFCQNTQFPFFVLFYDQKYNNGLFVYNCADLIVTRMTKNVDLMQKVKSLFVI